MMPSQELEEPVFGLAPGPAAAGERAPLASGFVSASAPFSWQRPAPCTAGPTRRGAAFAIDSAIVFALAWTATSLAASVGWLRIPTVVIFDRDLPALGLLWLVSIFELPLLLVYFTLLESRGGSTLGKLVMGLRVARVDGAKISAFDALTRNLLRLLWVTPLGPAFIILDLWSLGSTELDQRMGDLAAGTMVLDLRVR